CGVRCTYGNRERICVALITERDCSRLRINIDNQINFFRRKYTGYGNDLVHDHSPCFLPKELYARISKIREQRYPKIIILIPCSDKDSLRLVLKVWQGDAPKERRPEQPGSNAEGSEFVR